MDSSNSKCEDEASSAEKYDFDNGLKNYMNKSGVRGLEKGLKENLEKWRTVPIDIAITGESGAGKSCLINAMRGLTAEDEGAAEVGCTETTEEPTPYPHPENEQFIIWDLPGVGTTTEKHMKKNYLKTVHFQKYDFFIIVSSVRFTENDKWLAEEVEKQKKKFLFVRTKIDSDVANDKKSHPTKHNEQDLLEKLRNDAVKKLKNSDDSNVFLISNYHTDKWDFEKLAKYLVDNSETLKKEALILTLTITSNELLKVKIETLESRIWAIAALSGLGGAVSIPGVSAALDAGLIAHELCFYRKQLGIADKILEKKANEMKMGIATLKANLGVALEVTKSMVTDWLKKVAVGEVAETAISIAVPIVGSVIAGGVSFGLTYHVLTKELNKNAESAYKLAALTVEGAMD